MTKREEEDLIRRITGGDTEAFSYIVEAKQKNVYNLALRMTANEEDALDVSQEVFIKAYTSLPGFKGQSRLSVWLYRITYNTCLDYIKKTRRFQTESLSDDDESPPVQLPDMRYEPESEISRRELKASLDAAIDSLSEDHRQILIMREYSDMSYADIGLALGLNEGTVKSRLARARKAAADFLIRSGTIDGFPRQKDERR